MDRYKIYIDMISTCSYKDDEFVVNDNETVKMLRLQIEKKLEPGRYARCGMYKYSVNSYLI